MFLTIKLCTYAKLNCLKYYKSCCFQLNIIVEPPIFFLPGVCVCVCVCIYIYIYIHTHMYSSMHNDRHVCKYTDPHYYHTLINTHLCLWIYTYKVCVDIYAKTDRQTAQPPRKQYTNLYPHLMWTMIKFFLWLQQLSLQFSPFCWYGQRMPLHCVWQSCVCEFLLHLPNDDLEENQRTANRNHKKRKACTGFIQVLLTGISRI